jgi:hypothetical protein
VPTPRIVVPRSVSVRMVSGMAMPRSRHVDIQRRQPKTRSSFSPPPSAR